MLRVTAYNRIAAVIYAERWALRRDPIYYDFSDIGGDCTNFVSQCIYAGARVMNFDPISGWYYISPEERSPSWTGVEYLYGFLVNNKSVGPFGREVGRERVQIGDVVQLGRADGTFYHSMTVTATYPRILVCAHSDDSLNRPLSTYSFDKIRFIHIDGVRIE